jgi:putative nucleotidyltransferase with HDIG domain
MKGAGFGILNGILSSIIAVGLIPFFESFLKVPTRFKLLELADTNSPLLKRMQIEATGTYTHSIIVGNLAESAAANIGANALLARVGSYYHDIGKIDHASYFSENQQGMENRHKDLKPSVSRSILIAHVRKGAELARREGLPQVVVDFIEQHHGTTIMKFFYHQALDTSSKGISKEDFRYPGPRPQTKETAIVMLADSGEAASKITEGSHAAAPGQPGDRDHPRPLSGRGA